MDSALLGPLEVRRDGVPIEIAGARRRALLAVLLLRAGEVVPSERLLEDVWADAPPAAGATALRVRVSQLRRALGPAGALIVTRPPGYFIDVEPASVDIYRFERLMREGDQALARGDAAAAAPLLADALELWRGPALADFPYEAFAQGPIRRLEELRMVAREQLIAAQLALGRHRGVLGELRELVEQHPLRERLWAHLMLALYRDGRQAEALEAYRSARRTLIEEIGIEAGPQLQELERRILAQDVALDSEVRAERAARTVLVLSERDSSLAPLTAVGATLAREAGAELIVSALVPSQQALARVSGSLRALRERSADRDAAIRVAAFTSTDPGADATRLAAEHDVALLLVDAPPAIVARAPFAEALAIVLRSVAADVAVVTGLERAGADPQGPVVVPFAGHDHDWAALETAAWLARGRGSALRLVGTVAAPLLGRRDASRLLASASLALQRGVGVASESVLADPGAGSVLDAATDGAFLVAGLSRRWPKEGLGRARSELAHGARCPVLFVRGGVTPGGLAPPEALTRFTWSRAGA
jgi:DNA-binding SARP family transcriptional activator